MVMEQGRKILRELQELEADLCWRAVEERDARFDGTFFYGVRSTGVYCKPSCASRRPRREQVSFFGTQDEAESAGFRSCRRCRPRATGVRDPQLETIERACRLIEAAGADAPRLAQLAAELGVSQ